MRGYSLRGCGVSAAIASTSDYHAKLFAHELNRRHSVADDEKLAGALLDAQVDLNPHQVEAALFAFKSPLSKGAILADEVGLGKTIEAGLVKSSSCRPASSKPATTTRWRRTASAARLNKSTSSFARISSRPVMRKS